MVKENIISFLEFLTKNNISEDRYEHELNLECLEIRSKSRINNCITYCYNIILERLSYSFMPP